MTTALIMLLREFLALTCLTLASIIYNFVNVMLFTTWFVFVIAMTLILGISGLVMFTASPFCSILNEVHMLTFPYLFHYNLYVCILESSCHEHTLAYTSVHCLELLARFSLQIVLYIFIT